MQRCKGSLQLEICPPSECKWATENYFDQYIHLTGPPSLKSDEKSVTLKTQGVVELKDVSKTKKELDEKETELDVKQEQLQKEKDQLQEEKDQLQTDIQRMSEINKIQDSCIKLNIGGHLYTTSILTLAKGPQSMLAAMFSGRHSVKKEEDGSYFIDRDGTHFRYILNYLRDGGFKDGTLPSDILTELQTEAEYYQLSGLVALLQRILSEDLSDNVTVPKCVKMPYKSRFLATYDGRYKGRENQF